MGTPRVSFIVTCFNLGAYLGETLASIRKQTFKDYEICLVDDGSTDALTQRVVSEIGVDVTVILSDNRGLPAARNLGVSRTSGEFICAVDADDILAPTLAERSVSRLDADPRLAFVSHWRDAFGDQTWEWRPERCDFPRLLDSNTVNGAAFVRRHVVEAVGGWDESLRDGLEDWSFWIGLVEQGHRGDIIPEVLFHYRQRPDSMSRVNFAVGGHARLYRQLVDRHPESFSRYLSDLVARRNADLASGWALSDDARERLELEALPALARARDDVAAAERRRSRWEREKTIEQRQRASEERHRHLTAEVAELRASLSWRLTQPLRSVGGFVNRAFRRHP